MREGGILRFLLRIHQIKIHERRHQIGLASAHRQRKQVVGIGNAVEYLTEQKKEFTSPDEAKKFLLDVDFVTCQRA